MNEEWNECMNDTWTENIHCLILQKKALPLRLSGWCLRSVSKDNMKKGVIQRNNVSCEFESYFN